MFPLNQLGIAFTNGVLFLIDMPFIRPPTIGVEMLDSKRLQQCLQLQECFIFTGTQYIRQHFSRYMIYRLS